MNQVLRSSTVLLAVALAGVGATRAQTLLAPGQATQLVLDASSFSNELAIDVPADARQLRLQLEAEGGADVDLLLRYGDPFPVTGNAGVFGGVDWLMEHAHYRSVSPGASERITVTRSQHQPLRAGRWHLSLINFAGQPAPVTVQATFESSDPGPVPITTVFDDQAGCSARDATTAPWFDSTPATPVGGNPGSTRGEQRRNAFNHAVGLLSAQLPGVAGLRIRACWKDLGGDGNGATLASAGPAWIFRDDGAANAGGPVPQERSVFSLPTLRSTYTWYSAAGAAQQSGTELCRFASLSCNEVDIFIQFNSAIDGTVALGARTFYYGYDAPPPINGPRDMDFVATAMHEMGHGLGFFGLTNTRSENGPIGEKFRASYGGAVEPTGHNDAYSDALVRIVPNGPVLEFNRLDPAGRAQAMTSGLSLRWAEAEAIASPLNPRRQLAPPEDLLPMYAPAALSPGSTLSHLDQTFNSQLMSPFISAGVRSLGLARPMLSPLGWSSLPAAMPAPAVPYGGQWFDPARDGHGIDLHRVEGTADTYIAMLYSYDQQGLPEWFIAIGRIVDGVFRPGNDGNGNSLWRTRYLFGPPTGQEPDASVPGQIRIDFNPDQTERAPACQEGPGRNGPLALMTFSLANDHNLKWCLTQLVPQAARPATDRSGHWFAGDADAGWGVTTLAYGGGNGGLFTIVYFPDSQGRPRWAQAQTDAYQAGAVLDLQQVQGYCRTCPPPPGGRTATTIGQIRLDLGPPAGSDGQIRFNLEFNGSGGGQFGRDPAPMIRLAESAPDGD